jgi:amino acid permease
MFSYPLQVHPCRASVDAVLKWRPARFTPRGSQQGSPSRSVPLLQPTLAVSVRSDGISDLRFALITSTIIVLSYTVAMTVSSLDKVLAYVGSTGSTSISFILPGLFFYKISDPNSAHQQRLKEDDDEYESASDNEEGTARGGLKMSISDALVRRLALALAIYGFIVMFVCLGTNTFLNIAH